MRTNSNILKNIIKCFSENLIPISVSVICMIALYLRIKHLYHHDLWVDEKYYLLPLNGTFMYLLKALPANQPMAYLSGDVFIFYPFFKIFSYNKWGLAIPCIISTISGFYILYLICKRYFKSIWGYVITFSIVCFNATLIFHATEIRTYSMLPTLALAAFYVIQKIADSNFKLSTSKQIGATIFFVLVIWFHVYGIVMCAISLLFALLVKFKENDFKNSLKNALFFVGPILVFAMPLWLYCVLVAPMDVSSFGIDTFLFIPSPLKDFVGFSKGIFCNLIGYKILYFLALGMLFPFFIPYKNNKEQIFFLIIVVFLPLAMIFASDVLKNYWFLQRQFIWVMPLFAFFLGWTWDSLIVHVQGKGLFKKKVKFF